MKLGGKVIIVGGTGLLGYHAALEFLSKGYQVSALALPDVDLEGWYPKEIDVIHGDVFSLPGDELLTHFKDFDALVYAVGPDDRVVPDAPAKEFFADKLVACSEKVFVAARKAGIRRAVLLGSYFSHFDRIRPELNLAGRHPYIAARVAQSEAVIRAGGDRMAVMVLELPYIFGFLPNRVPLWKEVFLDRFLKLNPVMYPRGGSSMICATNVAEAIVGAVEKGASGECYAIGNQNLQWKELFRIMFGALGEKRHIVHVPYWLAAPVGRWMMWRASRRFKEPGLHLGRIFKDVLSRDFYLEPGISGDVLGYGSCDIREAIAETARACFPDGYKKKSYRGR